MSRVFRSTLWTLLVMVCLLAQPWPPQPLVGPPLPGETAQAQARRQVYLPFVRGPLGGPAFSISSPTPGSLLSRTVFFAVQAIDPETVARVEFRAGAQSLGSDADGRDGFRLAVNTSGLPAGPLELSAVATGPGGATVTQTVSVTVAPAATSSATASAQGAVVASETGSTIIVPPGRLAVGATISVDERTQAESTAANGINWDALGVTFLGEQQIQSSAPISGPINVASAGFGNRVQPGQAVVNYRLLPDADGDGARELVVVNTASVAPNNDVISDPVAGITLGAITRIGPGGATAVQAGDVLSGPPGTTFEIAAAGFNPISAQGNVAVYRSLVDGSELRVPALIDSSKTSRLGQVLRTSIPLLPVGAATLTLRNESSGATSRVISVTVTAAPPPSRAAATIIDEALATNIAVINQLAALTAGTAASPPAELVTRAISETAKMRALFQSIASSPTPTQTQALNQIASAIEQAPILLTPPAAARQGAAPLADPCSGDTLAALSLLLGSAGAVGAGLIGVGASEAALAALGLAVASGPGLIVAGAAIAAIAAGAGLGLAVGCLLRPPACGPSPSAAGAGGGGRLMGAAPAQAGGLTTGMGAAPPPGGNGCGNVSGVGGGGLQARQSGGAALEPGRIVVKVLPRSGTGRALSVFTGVNDAGGYFFVPLIPQGEPFRAVATDRLTGASATFEGIGPPTGQSVYMYFDFSQAQANVYPIAIGDTVSNGVPAAGAGNIETPTGLDIYTFSAAAGQQVFFDLQNNPADNSLALLNWQLVAPGGQVLFDRIFNCCGGVDPGVITMTQAGTYSLRVGGDSDPITGTYSFRLWNVPPPQTFAISVGDTITASVPGPGAGTIESPGVKDIYTFSASAGQQVFFDLQNNPADNSLALLNWQLVAPGGQVLFDRIFNCCGGVDPGVITMTQAGTYSLRVGGDSDPITGTYSFRLWNVPPPQTFAISVGDTITASVPGPGAGTIESPGVKDIYTFSASAGQQVFFDLQNNPADNSLAQLNWRLVAPDGQVLFDRFFNCCGGVDPGVITMTQAGTYSIVVGEDTEDITGTYSFRLWNVPPPQTFAISVGDTITASVPGPGAGVIESPGVKDIYTFSASAGQQVFFDLQNNPADNSLAQLNWQLVAPDGRVLFDRFFNCCGGSDPGLITLPAAGTYSIVVGEDGEDAIGSYSFQIRGP